MLMHYDYFDEGRAFGQGSMGWFILGIDSSASAAEVADAVDAQFANSPNQTRTSTEEAFSQSFFDQYGNIALIITLILSAVFFTILLVAGNTMAQSVRERISELAVLKTLAGLGSGPELTELGLLETVTPRLSLVHHLTC